MDIEKMYVDDGMSIPEISRCSSIALSTIRFRLKAIGVLRTRAEALRLSSKQGKLGLGNRGKTRNFSVEWKQNISKSASARWEGKAKGTSLKPNGYIEFTRGEHKNRSVHVVTMEAIIGRKLFPNECVHHKDNNRANNDPTNLQLMTRSEHSRLHALKRKQTNKGKS